MHCCTGKTTVTSVTPSQHNTVVELAVFKKKIFRNVVTCLMQCITFSYKNESDGTVLDEINIYKEQGKITLHILFIYLDIPDPFSTSGTFPEILKKLSDAFLFLMHFFKYTKQENFQMYTIYSNVMHIINKKNIQRWIHIKVFKKNSF